MKYNGWREMNEISFILTGNGYPIVRHVICKCLSNALYNRNKEKEGEIEKCGDVGKLREKNNRKGYRNDPFLIKYKKVNPCNV